MSEPGVQLRLVMLVLPAGLPRLVALTGYSVAVMVLALMLCGLALAVEWCDGRARR